MTAKIIYIADWRRARPVVRITEPPSKPATTATPTAGQT